MYLLNPNAPKFTPFLGMTMSYTTGKMFFAVPTNTAVRQRTAKKSLPCDRSTTHGNYKAHGKDATQRTAKGDARQRHHAAHGKDFRHGKGRSRRTAKKRARQRCKSLPCAPTMPCTALPRTAKEPLPCGRPLPCAC
jgi:hypothetical protein